jgi:hypothetical protein
VYSHPDAHVLKVVDTSKKIVTIVVVTREGKLKIEENFYENLVTKGFDVCVYSVAYTSRTIVAIVVNASNVN